MADITWLGTIDGDLDKAGNWDSGIPSSSDNAIINSGLYTDDPSSGTCDAGTVDLSNGFALGGTWNGDVVFDPSGAIHGGTWNGDVTGGGTISNGSFNGTVTTYGLVQNGTFNGIFNLNAGQIDGGTFNNLVEMIESGGSIGGGIFNGKVITLANNSIVSGTFNDELILVSDLVAFIPGSLANLKKIKVSDSSNFSIEKGINGSGILGMI